MRLRAKILLLAIGVSVLITFLPIFPLSTFGTAETSHWQTPTDGVYDTSKDPNVQKCLAGDIKVLPEASGAFYHVLILQANSQTVTLACYVSWPMGQTHTSLWIMLVTPYGQVTNFTTGA